MRQKLERAAEERIKLEADSEAVCAFYCKSMDSLDCSLDQLKSELQSAVFDLVRFTPSLGQYE